MTLPEPFPGTLDDGDGTRLAGTGPEFSPEMTEHLPHQAFIHALIQDRLDGEQTAVLEAGDRLWVLPDTFGTPPELPMALLVELADLVRRGHKLGLAAADRDAYVLARDALVLLLDDGGGRA